MLQKNLIMGKMRLLRGFRLVWDITIHGTGKQIYATIWASDNQKQNPLRAFYKL